MIFNVEENIAVIGGTWYGGEMKRYFSMMNYWLPLENKLSMHCSANVGEKDDVALFFDLAVQENYAFNRSKKKTHR